VQQAQIYDASQQKGENQQCGRPHQSMLDVVQVSAEGLLDNDLHRTDYGLHITHYCGQQRPADNEDDAMPNNANRTSLRYLSVEGHVQCEDCQTAIQLSLQLRMHIFSRTACMTG
jgi:hypothetical protein